MSEAIDLVLLGRYLEGTASVDERAMVDAWVAAASERRAQVDALAAAWAAETARLDGRFDIEAGWARLGRELRAVPRAPVWRRRMVWAAAVVVLAGVGTVQWLARRSPVVETVARPSEPREYAAPAGRRAVFRLLDGSEVVLNADSRLKVGATFGVGSRDVYLDGEAQFTVVHDPVHPFLVHTNRGVVRDVGTRFVIRAYSDLSVERIAVIEGEVAIGSATAPETALRAGQVAALGNTGRVTVLRGADVAAEVAWTEGRLVFAGAPLGEVARRLGRWYDLDIRVVDRALARQPVTGSYSNEPVAQVLALITSAVGARYEWRGRTVTIVPDSTR